MFQGFEGLKFDIVINFDLIDLILIFQEAQAGYLI